jgi:guanylate kinase
VLSSPSGGGKTTIIKTLRTGFPNLRYSVSATTRPPRKGEKDGVDYFFLDSKSFRQKIAQQAFVEWAIVHGEYYGTLKSQIDPFLRQGKHVSLDTDVQGGLNLKKLRSDVVLIYLLPPSMRVLKERLFERGTETSANLEKRLGVAQQENRMADAYDYIVINDRLEKAVEEIKTIIQEYEASSN